MANVNKPFGFRPVGKVGSNYDNQGLTQYKISNNYGTALYQGDSVKLSGGYLAIATTGAAIVGVFQGCYYIDPTTGKPTWKNYYPGSIVQDGIVALVNDDPNAEFVVQCSGIAAVTCVGRNADLDTAVAGSSTTGQSGQQVGVPATGNATYPWKVVGVYEDAEDNDVTAAYANLIVIPNNHLYKGGTGTAGV
jgi:hypothetical protein